MMSGKISCFFKIILITVILMAEFGCGNINANNSQVKPTISNDLVKTDRALEQGKVDMSSEKRTSDADTLQKVENKKTEETRDALQVKTQEYDYRNGNKYLMQYQNQSVVKQIILVEQSASEFSVAKLFLLIKGENGIWKEVLQCKAYLGKNGIDKQREGDVRTPTGDFGMTMAFGAKEDPGSLVPYTKLTNTMYLCGDREYYNQFIDVSKVNHTCSGNSEHLLSYVPQYNYALFFDYNKENVYGKGSAIFLHCFGNYPYTMGCVAVAEENMIKILRTVDRNARICIYPFQ